MTFREPSSTIATGDGIPWTLLPLTLDCAKGADVRPVAVWETSLILLFEPLECAGAGGVRSVAVWEAFPVLLAFLRIEEAEKWVMAL